MLTKVRDEENKFGFPEHLPILLVLNKNRIVPFIV